jgi:REP element-mobilizing transposase RayT
MLRRYEYRRRLPHYQPDFKIFFITFCTYRRWQLPARARQIVLDVFLHGNGKWFELLALVVMPDHVHVALNPLADMDGQFSLAEILQTIKSTSSHRINKELGHRGTVWQQESFDRALRREEHLAGKIEYMLLNPVRAGLVDDPMAYPWMWRRTQGWREIALRGPAAAEG